ncbi:MAG: cytidylate kinase-like family protein [Desulfobacteraceae bacterium]|nr:cytidylate kinase-like family protein [Desulfobacteraceae bacterium]
MAVITISRQFGAGGKTLGAMISEKLHYRSLDDQIIQEIARHAKVSKKTVISMERTAGGTISRIISSLLSRNYMDRLTGEARGYMDEEIYIQTLYDVMFKLASEKNVILTGRGGQYILENFEDAFHILLIANEQDRIDFMQKHYNLTATKARAAVMSGENRRTNLYRKFDKKDYNDPIHYHLVLNMSRIPFEKAVDLVCNLVKG